MCYSGTCSFEITSGECIGQCRLPDGITCPKSVEKEKDFNFTEEDYED